MKRKSHRFVVVVKTYGKRSDATLALLLAFACRKPDGLGVCSVALGYKDDSDSSWDKAEAAFAKMDEAGARRIADAIIAQLQPKLAEQGKGEA